MKNGPQNRSRSVGGRKKQIRILSFHLPLLGNLIFRDVFLSDNSLVSEITISPKYPATCKIHCLKFVHKTPIYLKTHSVCIIVRGYELLDECQMGKEEEISVRLSLIHGSANKRVDVLSTYSHIYWISALIKSRKANNISFLSAFTTSP